MKHVVAHSVRTTKAYQAPKLKKYGKVRNLTMSGSKNTTDTDNEITGTFF